MTWGFDGKKKLTSSSFSGLGVKVTTLEIGLMIAVVRDLDCKLLIAEVVEWLDEIRLVVIWLYVVEQ